MKKTERQVSGGILKSLLGVLCALQLSVTAAYGGWTQTGAGPYNYLDVGSWAGGTIDNVFPSSTTLTAAQTATFGANTTLSSGLDFSYGGNFGLTLIGSGAARTLTLGGDINLNTAGGTTANVTFGNQSTANQFLHVDLGATNRTFTVATGRKLWFWNNLVSNGGLIKNGAGELVLRAQTSTFTGDVVVNGGTLTIGEQNAIADGCLGNPDNDVSLLNGSTMKFGSSNDKAHVLLSSLRDFTLSGAVNFTTPYGSANVHIPGDIQSTGGLTSILQLLLSGNNTFASGITYNGGVRFSSYENIGGTSSTIARGANASTLGLTVLGNSIHNLSGNTLTFGTTDGFSIEIQDPDNVFTWDKLNNRNPNSASNPTFFKYGLGTLLVTTNQNYINGSGISTMLYGGVMKIDYTAGGSLIDSPGNQCLGFGGGALYLLGKTASGVTQNLSSIRLDAGGGALVVDNQNGTAETLLNLGNFAARSTLPVVGSSLNIRTINAGTGSSRVTSTAVNDASGIIGYGRVVFNGIDWPRIASGTTVGNYTDYTIGLPSSGASSSVNYIHTGNGSVTASETANTLKLLTTQGGESLAISADQNLSLNAGGLLFAGANDYTVAGGTLSAGTTRIGTSSGQDLVVQHYGAGTLTIGSVITNAPGIASRTGNTTSGSAVVTGLSSTADLYVGMAVKVAGVVTSFTISSVNSASQITLNGSTGITTGTPSLTFTGVNALTIAGTGTVKLTSANTYTGQTFVNGATLEISNNNQLNNSANTQLNLAGAKLKATETLSTGRAIALNGGGATVDVANGKTLTLTGTVSGGRLTLANSDGGNGTLALNGVNTFIGGVDVNGGILQLGNNNAIYSLGFNTLQFGTATTQTLRINGTRTVTVAGLTSGSSTAVIENGATGAAQLNVYNGADNTFSGVMQDGALGTLAFAKGGGGTLTLSGTQTYTGATTVQGGILAVNGSLAAASAVTVQKGALGGTGTVNGTVTVKNGGAMAPGASAGTLNTGALTLEAGSALNFELGSSASDRIAVTGDLTLDGTVNVTGLDGFGAGNYTLITYTGTLTNNGLEVGTIPDVGLLYTVRTNSNSVTLSIGAPPSLIVIR